MIYFLFFIRVQYSPIPLVADLLYFLYELSPPLAMWILNFMPERPQSLHVNDRLADSVGISTGSPQGCVLTPFLFILYPNNCRSCHIFTSVVCVCVCMRRGRVKHLLYIKSVSILCQLCTMSGQPLRSRVIQLYKNVSELCAAYLNVV